MKLILKNARGQTAIFIALIFQVLFVLFAMSLNVALVIHDKINLQNSVDLAAYYAAERQAEHLNAMAHVNYQIRQAWKLLSWRYRELSTLGFFKPPSWHPIWQTPPNLTETEYRYSTAPSVCVTYAPTWTEVPANENLCNVPNLNIPALPQVPVIAGFIGINQAVAALSTQLINQFSNSCDNFAAYNWWFAMVILQSYRIEQRNRKLLIEALAQNLAAQPDDFVDINGQSAKAGAYQTFLKNLTYTNNNANLTFSMLNSLYQLSPSAWLPEVKIDPTILYTDALAGASCSEYPQIVNALPRRANSVNILLNPLTFNAKQLMAWAAGEPPPTDPYSFSIGVEKNPWVMAYVGVKATSAPQQIFFPFGPTITLTARGFAQPFGGRMGPWYGSQWPQGSSQSTGTQIDALLPPRPNPDGTLAEPSDPRRLPNYSRFPGDVLGLTSSLAQASLLNLATMRIQFAYFTHIYEDFTTGSPNDTLAWDYNANTWPVYRNYEVSAIAPDLFDITYYSVEPDFALNYLNSIQANQAALKIPSSIIIRGDLGTHLTQYTNYSVQDQMTTAQTNTMQIPEAFYYVRNKTNLLTSWAEGEGAVNYVFPNERFGLCQLNDDNFKDKVPGSCVAMGGRTGYSVEIVSRSSLNSTSNNLGGKDVPPGPIVNPPAAFGW